MIETLIDSSIDILNQSYNRWILYSSYPYSSHFSFPKNNNVITAASIILGIKYNTKIQASILPVEVYKLFNEENRGFPFKIDAFISLL